MKVLFVCVGNSGRSQMAEAIFNYVAPKNMRAVSAGTEPAARVSRKAVEVMGEIGLDITGARPKKLSPEMVEEADRIITMGCLNSATCPAFLIKDKSKLDDWNLEDPKDLPVEKVREIRDQITDRVMDLVSEMLR